MRYTNLRLLTYLLTSRWMTSVIKIQALRHENVPIKSYTFPRTVNKIEGTLLLRERDGKIYKREGERRNGTERNGMGRKDPTSKGRGWEGKEERNGEGDGREERSLSSICGENWDVEYLILRPRPPQYLYTGCLATRPRPTDKKSFPRR